MALSSFAQSLDAFLSGPDRVLVIRGHWGVGKTYSWDSYVSEKIRTKSLNQIAYSYVSLFGKSSLAEVRSSVFQNARPLSPEAAVDAEIDRRLSEATRLRDRLPWVRGATELAKEKAPFLGWLTRTAKSAPFTDKLAPLLSTLEYSLVGNYLICVDDLERKGAALSVREVMGLIDELAQRKACKIVLIFNDKSLANDNDRSEFESYREKVVDSEIEFSPSHEENLAKVISPDHCLHGYFLKTVVPLDLKNIRVLKKLRRMTDLVETALKECHTEILQEYATHASILLWSFYMRSEALPHSFVVEQLSSSSWAAYLKEDKTEPTEDEKRYKTIASSVRIEPSIFDRHILDYLRRGYFDLPAVQQEVQELIQKAEIRRASARLNGVWRLYTESFAPNQAEIKKQLRDVLSEEVSLLSVSEYSGALSMLESLGDDPTDLLRRYIQLRKEDLTAMDRPDSRYLRPIHYAPMRTEIDNLGIERRKLNLDDVAFRIAKHHGWNQEDIEFLVTLTADDFYRWIQSSPTDLPVKLRSGLLFFRNLTGSRPEDSESYSKIYAAVEGALRRLAAESEIGRLRVKHVYDIDTEPKETSINSLRIGD
jgi:hypothetical protein